MCWIWSSNFFIYISLLQADRNYLSGKIRGGGLCVFINKGWCTNCSIISSYCSESVEHLIIKCRPHYLIREFTAVYIVAVYIPPSAKANEALGKLHDNIYFLQNKHPEAFFVIAGDFNHVNLTDVTSGFTSMSLSRPEERTLLIECTQIDAEPIELSLVPTSDSLIIFPSCSSLLTRGVTIRIFVLNRSVRGFRFGAHYKPNDSLD